MPALQNVIVDKPEAARQKRAFTFRQTIAGIFDFVAQNKFPIDEELVLDSSKRSLDPWIACREKPDERDQQQAGIEPLGAVGLHKTVKIAIETALADLGMNFVGDLPPLLFRFVESSRRHFPRRAIERDPSHHLRVDKVLPPATHFPKTVVWLPPSRRQILQYNRSQR